MIIDMLIMSIGAMYYHLYKTHHSVQCSFGEEHLFQTDLSRQQGKSESSGSVKTLVQSRLWFSLNKVMLNAFLLGTLLSAVFLILNLSSAQDVSTLRQAHVVSDWISCCINNPYLYFVFHHRAKFTGLKHLNESQDCCLFNWSFHKCSNNMWQKLQSCEPSCTCSYVSHDPDSPITQQKQRLFLIYIAFHCNCWSIAILKIQPMGSVWWHHHIEFFFMYEAI